MHLEYTIVYTSLYVLLVLIVKNQSIRSHYNLNISDLKKNQLKSIIETGKLGSYTITRSHMTESIHRELWKRQKFVLLKFLFGTVFSTNVKLKYLLFNHTSKPAKKFSDWRGGQDLKLHFLIESTRFIGYIIICWEQNQILNYKWDICYHIN
jgi:hypothetical protein